MSTISTLLASGEIFLIDVLDPDEMPMRYLYGLKRVDAQLDALQAIQPSWHRDKLSVGEQLYELTRDFCLGKPLRYQYGIPGFNHLEHKVDGFWELKHADIRCFGWFTGKDCFLISDAVHAQPIKDGSLNYSGYITQGNYHRSRLGTQFIQGGDPDHVISNYTFSTTAGSC